MEHHKLNKWFQSIVAVAVIVGLVVAIGAPTFFVSEKPAVPVAKSDSAPVPYKVDGNVSQQEVDELIDSIVVE